MEFAQPTYPHSEVRVFTLTWKADQRLVHCSVCAWVMPFPKGTQKRTALKAAHAVHCNEKLVPAARAAMQRC